MFNKKVFVANKLDKIDHVEKIKELLSLPTTSPDSFNYRLIERQGLTQGEVLILCRIHDKKDLIFEKIKKARSKKMYTQLSEELEQIEFAMQRAWKFDEDRKHHTWWCQVPKCKCQNLNREEARRINPACPIHSK